MAGIRFSSITKGFGDVRVLRDVSLDVAPGEFLTLLGPSGCGKTTLLRILAGLETQDAGEISIGGRAVDDLAPKDRDVAMVFQSYALYPYMTVAQNIALPLVMRRMSAAQRFPLVGRFLPGAAAAKAGIDTDVASVAGSLGLDQLLARKPSQLSGGQRQRVALARAMVRRPKAFLMDEPLSNLDAKLRVQARAEIADLHRRLGVTFIYVTHDQAEAMTMSDRVAVMMGGKLLQVAPPRTLYDDPATLEVATFIGTPEINVMSGAVRADGAVDVAGRAWSLGVGAEPGATVSAAVRPEAFTIHRGVAPAPCAIVGSARHVEHLGAESLVHLKVHGLDRTLVARAAPPFAASVKLDEPLTFAADPARVLAFGSDGGRLAVRPRPAVPALREAVNG